MRKRTVFKLCSSHEHLGGGQSTAAMACMGGPAYGRPCQGRYCEIRPGTDYFTRDTTDYEAKAWVENWAVNKGEV